MTRILELVGPGGAGKTSIAVALNLCHDIPLIAVYGRNAPVAKMRAGLATIGLAARFRLDFAETLSLFRKCSSVENGLLFYCPSAVPMLAIDEGPLRTLRDTRCSSYRERRAWWHYAKRVVRRLAGRGVSLLLVEIRLEDEVRRSRYDDRVRKSRQESAEIPTAKRRLKQVLDRLSRRERAQSIPSLGRATWTLIAGCTQLATSVSLQVRATESPAEIADRLRDILESLSADNGRAPHRT